MMRIKARDPRVLGELGGLTPESALPIHASREDLEIYCEERKSAKIL
jgi:hypothetical protein